MAARCGDTDCGEPNPSLPCPRCGLVAYCDAVCQRRHWRGGGHSGRCRTPPAIPRGNPAAPPDLAPPLQITLVNGLRVGHRSQLGKARLGTRVPSHSAPGEAPDLPPSPAARPQLPDHQADTVVRLPKGGAIWQCARLFVEFTALHTAELLGLLTDLDPPPATNSAAAAAAAAACPLGVRVVELGAGTGVCGLSLAVHPGVGTVTLTDGDPNVLPLLRHNAWLNQQCSGVAVTRLGWGCAGHIAGACNANGGCVAFDLASMLHHCSDRASAVPVIPVLRVR